MFSKGGPLLGKNNTNEKKMQTRGGLYRNFGDIQAVYTKKATSIFVFSPLIKVTAALRKLA